VNLTVLGFGIWSRDIFFFPLGIAYLTYGLVRAAVVSFLERGEGDDADEDDDVLGADEDVVGEVADEDEPPDRPA
jgi:hypothetical protein